MIGKLDNKGRIQIPKEFRQHLKLEDGDSFNISIQDNKIVIEKETEEDWEEDNLTKEEYKGVVQKTMEDVQDYLEKISELLEELQHLE